MHFPSKIFCTCDPVFISFVAFNPLLVRRSIQEEPVGIQVLVNLFVRQLIPIDTEGIVAVQPFSHHCGRLALLL